MEIKLSLLSVVLGLAMALPQLVGLAQPDRLAAAVRRLPRNLPLGIFLMLLGTAWFVWNFSQESIADFSAYKSYMLIGFASVGVLSCVYVQDFLAIRGLAVLLLLLGKLMVDTGRPHLGESPLVLVIQGWAYVLVLAGLWFTVTPWRLRDILEWATASHARIRLLCTVRLAFAVFIVVLGLTTFRSM